MYYLDAVVGCYPPGHSPGQFVGQNKVALLKANIKKQWHYGCYGFSSDPIIDYSMGLIYVVLKIVKQFAMIFIHFCDWLILHVRF